MSSHVDPRFTGVWRREAITTPDGARDDTTRVFWLQTRSWYADIRVPAGRPVRPTPGLEACSDDELIALAAQEGFAGELTAGPRVLSWRRDLDYQPPGAWPDEGYWELDADVLVERGLHVGYEEIWRLQPESRGERLAFGLAADDAAPGRRGLLVVAGDCFLSVLGRPSAPPGPTLHAAVAERLAAGDRAGARALLDMPIAYGRIEGAGAPWTVTLSTCPWLEGASLWSAGPPAFDADAALLVAPSAEGARAWRLLDSTLEPAAVAACLRLAP